MSKKIEKIKEYIKENKLKTSIIGCGALAVVVVPLVVLATTMNDSNISDKKSKVAVVIENKEVKTETNTVTENTVSEEVKADDNVQVENQQETQEQEQSKLQQQVQKQEQSKPQQQTQRQEQAKPQQQVQRQEQPKPQQQVQPKPQPKPESKPNTEDEPLMIFGRVWVPINKYQKVFYTEEEIEAYLDSLTEEEAIEGQIGGWISVPSNKNGGVVYVVKINDRV